ncbi:MAG: NAD-dependent epimerase/dehydratase family protein [Acidimicrobiia bacterium]|nr:NAD-dependent epimerase/dehydratase family protein [Acidimicrobiia bacterium]
MAGAAGLLGRRVMAALAAADLDAAVVDATGTERGDTAGHQVAEVLVWLSPIGEEAPGPDGTGTADATGVAPTAPFALADRLGVAHVVLLSSAYVYGLRSDHPVPLTEAAPVRPPTEVAFVAAKAAAEAAGRRWAGASGRSLTVLRPVVTVGEASGSWFRGSGWAPLGAASLEACAPVQFLHLDDAASAVVVACEQRPDGAYNVAPDGWLSHDELVALAGPVRRVPLPGKVGEQAVVAQAAATAGSTDTARLALAVTSQPCVVSNDRLRSLGWEPRHSNAEAYVLADAGGPLARLTPAQRQVLPFAAVAGVVAAAGVAVWQVLRRRR